MKKTRLLLVLWICLCGQILAQPLARSGTEAKDYERLGLKPNQVELWEDGMRTSGKRNTYEWWYFDVILKDSSKLVVVFYTKPLAETVFEDIKPYITIIYTDKNGKRLLNEEYYSAPQDYAISKEKCEVRFGNNYCRGDLSKYEIHLNTKNIQADIQLLGEIPAWRPATGHLFFGKKEQDYFAWLPSVPKGKATGSMKIQGQTIAIEGSGYHDHNWGNRVISDLMEYWYWSRTEIGEYTVIASQIYAKKKYGGQAFPIFFVAKGDKVVAENGDFMKFKGKEEEVDSVNKKLILKDLTFAYQKEEDSYTLHLEQKRYIHKAAFVDIVKKWQRVLLKAIRLNPTYYRMEGKVTLETQTPTNTENIQGGGIWELFYLGNWKASKK
ncbi:MAG: lipocalin-like domain-containing protein [Bacteroidia bacterium]